MDFDAIRRAACGKPPVKKPEPAPPTPAPPAAAAAPPPPNPTPPPPPPGPPQQGHSFPPHMGQYMEAFENVRRDPRFGYVEHSRTWKLGFNPNYTDNYSYQDYEGHIPAPQDYYRSSYGNPGMNSRVNHRQMGYYPDDSMGTLYYPADDNHCHPGCGATSRGRRGISAPPPRLALPPPNRYMDDYCDHDHHHGYGHSSPRRHYYPGNIHRGREYGPPALLGPPPPDPYHRRLGGPPRGAGQYYLPSTYDNCSSYENPNTCSIM